ncbi:S-layer homology domain-containing protein [Caryophanon latum]|uniref:SLH domain-containing protein n=1 Tax=Caryophanon latum TaxID=33977 RepID=A0A1C0YQ44_9BACL|nr:S-layer homology domain-containing protein [Caryophanon latum]OCS89189.1 hypothetical protein A6K76_12600 [Caryophanon latum]
MKKIVSALLIVVLAFSFSLQGHAAFKDVSNTHSLATEINYLTKAGIISGYEDGKFRPNELIKKKHVASMLVKSLDLQTTNLRNPGYKDIPTTHQYYKEIAAVYTAGIFNQATYFQPEASLTRAQMAEVIAKAFKLQSISQNAVDYEDVSSRTAGYHYIQLVTMNSIATGELREWDPYFLPDKLLTRAHFSAFLARALTLRKETAADLMPSQSYTYTYATKDNYYTAKYDGRDEYEFGNGRSWSYFSKSNGKKYANILYGSQYSEYMYQRYFALYSHDFLPYLLFSVDVPISLGLKYDVGREHVMAPNPYPASVRVIDTKKTVKVAGNTYTNVIEFENTYFKSMTSKRFSHKIYIAAGHGVIGIKNEKDQWEFWLHSRVAK